MALAAGRFAEPGRINDNEIVVLGDGFGQRETQRAAIEEADPRDISMVLLEVADDVHADPFIAEEIVADSKDECGTHGIFTTRTGRS